MVPFTLLGAPLSAAILVSRTPDARDCPDAGRVAAEVERIIGRPLATPGARSNELLLRADFSRTEGIYEAKVLVTGVREGERTLRDAGASCEALADAVAVTAALLLDPSQRSPSPVSPRTSAPQPTPSWLGLWASGRFGAGVGLVGAPTWIGGAGLGASLGPLTSVELGAALSGSHASELGEGAVRVRLWYVQLGAFRSLTGENFQLGPCLQLMGGALRGSAEGYPTTSAASLAWFALGAGARADFRVAPGVRLGVRTLAIVSARKESFSIGYVGTAHESSPVAGVAEFVVGVKFW